MSRSSLRTATTLLGAVSLLFTTIAQAETAQPGAQPLATEATPTAPVVVAPPDEGPDVLFPPGGPTTIGGYGSLEVAYSRVADNDVALLCGEGALVANRRYVLGLAGCGTASRIDGEGYGSGAAQARDRLEFGYGGVMAGYQFFPKKTYNLALTAMIGGGAAEIVNRNDSLDYSHEDYEHVRSVDRVFVAEPRLSAYLNLTRWARVGAFAGYRLVSNVDMANLEANDLSGPVAGGSLQFGWF